MAGVTKDGALDRGGGRDRKIIWSAWSVWSPGKPGGSGGFVHSGHNLHNLHFENFQFCLAHLWTDFQSCFTSST